MPSNFKALAAASGGEPTDANFKNVTLLLHGDGSNGAQNNTFIDSSTNNFTITRNGNTTQGSFSPYGSLWSNYFDGNGDYLTLSSNAAFGFGTGDYTVEFWIYLNSLPSSGKYTLVDFRTASDAQTHTMYVNSSGYLGFFNGSADVTSSSTPMSANAWTHIAYSRASGTLRIYVNGVQAYSASNSIDYQSSRPLTIGAAVGGLEPVAGYISNFRVVKGTAVYTSAFTPSTTPLTAITNTSLLTCADNRFRDGSTNNFTITRNGDVKVTNFAPFAPSSAYSTTTNGGSIFVDGTGDYLTLASNANLAPESSAFTWECWFYPNSFVGNTGDGDTLWLTSASGGLQIGCDANTANWGVARSGIAWVLQTSTFPTNGMWNHIAIVRSGTGTNQAAIFLNGTRIAQGTLSSSFSAGSTNVLSANGGAGNSIDGYVSSMRLVKGTAIYDPANSTYTVPTTPLSAVTNTQLLLNATNAAIFDNSMKNDLETVGNAQISTSVKKFGTGSMYFDGSGDWLQLPSSQDLGVGTGDFTIEAWIYPTGGTGNRHVFSGGQTNAVAVNLNSSGKIAVAKSGVVEIAASTTTISTSTWTHIAVTRSGNTFRVFVNGTLETTATSSQDFTNFTDNRVGYENQASYYVGYIDDLRITKGVARYTASFTAPTAPFPNK